MHRVSTALVALILLAAPLCAARDLAVIVNKNNPSSTVTPAELEKILKTGTPIWPSGSRVKVILTDPSSPDSRMLLERAYKLSPEEIRNLANSHKPEIQIVASDDLVLTIVESTPGAIGIINVYSINSHVKVLKVDGKLPMEPGYLLHGN